MKEMSTLGVTAYSAGFPPIAHSTDNAARAVVAGAPQRKRPTAATDPSVDRGFI